jgi:hypothetical protein
MSFTPLVPAILKMVPLKYRLQVYRLFFSRHLFFFSRRFEKYPELFENCRVHFAQGARLKLCPTDQGHAKIALTSVYEPELSRQISSLARIGGLLVDVGANYGYYSVLWTYGHLSNRVIAFEASPRNIIPLKHNIASNGLLDRVEIFQKALGRDRGSMRFLLGPE